jgi:hypothetical protein
MRGDAGGLHPPAFGECGGDAAYSGDSFRSVDLIRQVGPTRHFPSILSELPGIYLTQTDPTPEALAVSPQFVVGCNFAIPRHGFPSTFPAYQNPAPRCARTSGDSLTFQLSFYVFNH